MFKRLGRNLNGIRAMYHIQQIVDSLYTLKTEDKIEIKNLIKHINENKNHIRKIKLNLIQEIKEKFNNTEKDTEESLKILEIKMKFMDEFIKFLIFWRKKETL